MMLRTTVLVLWFTLMAACTARNADAPASEPVVVSLLGKAFFEPGRSPAQQARLDSSLRVAKTNFEQNPSEENYIWYARREGYLMHFNEAITILSEGIEKYPESYRLLRHRGHRYISIRKFDEAIRDLERAARLMPAEPLEVEPDGAPNKLNIPLSNTQFNVWYHLGLAFYLKGDFHFAEETYTRCLSTCENDDSRIAVLDWLYMIKRRLNKHDEAAALLAEVSDSLTVIENDSYYQRLKMYKGWISPEQLLQADTTLADYDLSLATQGYGVGNYFYCNGDTTRAFDVFQSVVNGKLFAAFGFIAAETELARRAGLTQKAP